MGQKFDNFIKKKFDEREFEFKEEYWAGAEAMIEAQDSKRDRKSWLGLLLLLLFFVGAGSWFFYPNSAKKIAINSKENTTINKELEANKNNQSPSKDLTINHQNSISQTTTNSILTDEKLTSNNDGNEKLKPTLGNETNLNSNNTFELTNQKGQSSNKSSTQKNNQPNKYTTSTIKNKTEDIEQTVPKTKERNSPLQQAGTIYNNLDNGNVIDGVFVEKEEDKITQFDGNLSEENQKNKINTQISDVPFEAVSTKKTEQIDEKKTSVLKEEKSILDPISMIIFRLDESDSKMKMDDIYRKEEAERIASEKANVKKAVFKDGGRKGFGLGLALNASPISMTQSIGDSLISTDREYTGYQFGIGLTVNYRFNKLLSCHGDLLYKFQKGNLAYTKLQEVKTYSFGSTSKTDIFKTSEIHTIDVPLYIQLHVKKHLFDIGMVNHFLMGIKGGVSRPYVESSDLSRVSFEIPEETFIVREGYKKYYPSILLGYQYAIGKRLTVGLRADFNPGSILDDQYDLPNAFSVDELPFNQRNLSKLQFSFTANYYFIK